MIEIFRPSTCAAVRQSIRTGLTFAAIGAIFGALYFWSLQSNVTEDDDNFRMWFQNTRYQRILKTATAAFVILPLIGGLARFASMYPPRPIGFAPSLILIGSIALIAHSCIDVKKAHSLDEISVIAATVVGGLGCVLLGSLSDSDPM